MSGQTSQTNQQQNPAAQASQQPQGHRPPPWIQNLGGMTSQQASKLAKQAATAQFLDVIGTQLAQLHLETTHKIVSQMTGLPVYSGNVSPILGTQDQQQSSRVRTSAAE